MTDAERKYLDAVKALNEAAYAALRAGADTTELPLIDRQTLRAIAKETDRLVDQDFVSGMDVCKPNRGFGG